MSKVRDQRRRALVGLVAIASLTIAAAPQAAAAATGGHAHGHHNAAGHSHHDAGHSRSHDHGSGSGHDGGGAGGGQVWAVVTGVPGGVGARGSAVPTVAAVLALGATPALQHSAPGPAPATVAPPAPGSGLPGSGPSTAAQSSFPPPAMSAALPAAQNGLAPAVEGSTNWFSGIAAIVLVMALVAIWGSHWITRREECN